MGKTTKILLALSVLGLVLGMVFVTHLIDPHGAVALYVLLPAGAIFFGLFLISLMLEKETARFDAEKKTLLDASAKAESTSGSAPSQVAPKRLTTAHAR